MRAPRGRVAFALSAAGLCVAASFATASGAFTDAIPSRTVVCSARVVIISFDPRLHVEVRSGRTLLGSASFTAAGLSRTCKTLPEPVGYADAGLGEEIHRAITVRCTTAAPVRLHVNAITENGKSIGSNLLVGTGRRLRVVASAVLKNKGDAAASGFYFARRSCSLVR